MARCVLRRITEIAAVSGSIVESARSGTMSGTINTGADELRRAVAALERYHTIDLGAGVVTPDTFDLRPVVGHFGIPERLDGKTGG